MDITVHFCGTTVKQLRRAWQDAVQRGQGRLIRHITALLEVGTGGTVAQAAVTADQDVQAPGKPAAERTDAPELPAQSEDGQAEGDDLQSKPRRRGRRGGRRRSAAKAKAD